MAVNPVRQPTVDDSVAVQRLFVATAAPTTEFNGQAPKGALAVDVTGANLYINAGTLATNDWKLVTRAA